MKNFAKIFGTIFIFSALMTGLTMPAFAQTGFGGDTGTGFGGDTGTGFGGDATGSTLPSDTGSSGGETVTVSTDVRLVNPLSGAGIDSVSEFIGAILEVVLVVAVPIVALFIIYSGFLFVTAQGNPEKLKTARDTFLYTLIGAALVLAAWVIAQAIQVTVEEIVETSYYFLNWIA